MLKNPRGPNVDVETVRTALPMPFAATWTIDGVTAVKGPGGKTKDERVTAPANPFTLDVVI